MYITSIRGKKGSKNQYIPGKGLKQHEDEILVAANNPALQTVSWKEAEPTYAPDLCRTD